MANNRDEKAVALIERVTFGIRDYYESDSFKEYLRTMSKFHNYSARNAFLILMANPDATHVAGFTSWKYNFKRHVKKGEKGIPILGYAPKKITVGEETINEKGEKTTEQVEKLIPGYKVVYVYDISQTEGEPLPELTKELTGSVDRYDTMLHSIEEITPFPISFEELDSGKKGYYDPLGQCIVVNKGMSEQQTIKTLIHEITHSVKHAIDDDTKRIDQEIEAECTAFIVCEHFGIDTSDYSFPYIAAWSKSKTLDELIEKSDDIFEFSNSLIVDIEKVLEKNLQKKPELLTLNEMVSKFTKMADEANKKLSPLHDQNLEKEGIDR